MEWKGGCKNPAQLMSPTLDMNASEVSYQPEDGANQQFTLAAGSNGSQTVALPLSEWINCQQPCCNHAQFLGESSTFPYKAPMRDIKEGPHLPLGSILSANGVSEIQREILYNISGRACSFKPTDFPLDMDAWKARFLRPHHEGEPGKKIKNTEYQICGQTHNSWTQKSKEDKFDGSQPNSRVTVAAPGLLSKTSKSLSRQRATANDRRRRLRIAERLKALQQLIPHPEEGNKASLMDDIIDYIKCLQLQIKELSRSRLGGQSTSDPFVFLEGYGHYLLHEQMLNKPLEEMLGKLLEVNPSAATLLLESRGLSVMPMALAEELLQAE